jgi:hypothetical protein
MKRKQPKSLHSTSALNQDVLGVHFDFRYISEEHTYNQAKPAHWMKLFVDLKQISSDSWANIIQNPRQTRQGYEKITQDALKKPMPSCNIPNDAKLDVIRVAGNNDARLVGYKPQNSSVFYVLWLDFDFSVYHHG